MLDCVLWQLGFEQRIPVVALQSNDGVFAIIDDRLLHFANYLVTGLTVAFDPHAHSDEYMDWFMHISHPYISPRVEDDLLVVLLY